LIFLTTPWGLPCCVRFPCVHAVATTPARRLGASSARFPSRVSLPRYGSRVGPRIDLFEAYSAFTRVTACTLALSPYFVTRLSEGFNYFVTSIVAPVASGWSICRVGVSPTGKASPFHGARQKRSSTKTSPNEKGTDQPIAERPQNAAKRNNMSPDMTPTGVRYSRNRTRRGLCRPPPARFHSPPIIRAACRRPRRWVRRALADIPPPRSHPPIVASPAARR
jgi:hypothetical protein